MIIPEFYRSQAVKKALQMLKDGAEVVVVGKYGAVVRDHQAELAITRNCIDVKFIAGEETK